MSGNKYKVSKGEAEGEILPNKLGLTTKVEIEKSEFEGFLFAYKTLFDELNSKTKFDDYVKAVKMAANKEYKPMEIIIRSLF